MRKIISMRTNFNERQKVWENIICENSPQNPDDLLICEINNDYINVISSWYQYVLFNDDDFYLRFLRKIPSFLEKYPEYEKMSLSKESREHIRILNSIIEEYNEIFQKKDKNKMKLLLDKYYEQSYINTTSKTKYIQDGGK